MASASPLICTTCNHHHHQGQSCLICGHVGKSAAAPLLATALAAAACAPGQAGAPPMRSATESGPSIAVGGAPAGKRPKPNEAAVTVPAPPLTIGQPRCGWDTTRTAKAFGEVPAGGLFAGTILLKGASQLLGAQLPASALGQRKSAGAAVRLGAVYRQNVCTYHARVVPEQLSPGDRARVGVAPTVGFLSPALLATLLEPKLAKKPKKKRRRKQAAASAVPIFPAPPPDSLAVAVAIGGGDAERSDAVVLHLAIGRLVSRQQLVVRYSVDCAGLAGTGTDDGGGGGGGGGSRPPLVLQAGVYLLRSAFTTQAAGSPDDPNSGDADLAVLLQALAEQTQPEAPVVVRDFKILGFYETLKRTAETDPATIPTPAGMTCTLRPYQCRALAWMAARETPSAARVAHPLWQRMVLECGEVAWANVSIGRLSRWPAWQRPAMHGGILAEEMGLGKTVEVTALVSFSILYRLFSCVWADLIEFVR